jgi:hypothetical protein
MIKESNICQICGEPERKWFSSDYFDLIVWFDEERKIIGFQLCYDKFKKERAITWTETNGYSHCLIDDGENNPGRYKASPVLTDDSLFDKERIAAVFLNESRDIDSRISTFVLNKILAHEK